MEYLDTCVRNGSVRTPWRLLHGAALGLAYLHERNIVHCNLQSSSILVGSDGLAKLADLGYCGSLSKPTLFFSRTVRIGSMRWQAPERIQSLERETASDVFSFGLCILHVLTEMIPWSKSRGIPSKKSRRFGTLVNKMAGVALHSSTKMHASLPSECAVSIRTSALHCRRLFDCSSISLQGSHQRQQRPSRSLSLSWTRMCI
jgi:serine/threonine protein kinase